MIGGRSPLRTNPAADSDWSPERGPLDAKAITYAQELVWALFGHYRTAAAELRLDTGYADTTASRRSKPYLPQVSATTGWLEEWMSPDNPGETTHRHLSPLVVLFPGDRIRPDGATPADLVTGATALLTARGMESFGWANACQLVVHNLRPSTGGGNGTAPNLLDIHEVVRGRGILQIDAGFGVELRRRDGKPTRARIHSVGGRTTTVAYGGVSRTVTLRPGASVTLKDFAR